MRPVLANHSAAVLIKLGALILLFPLIELIKMDEWKTVSRYIEAVGGSVN